MTAVAYQNGNGTWSLCCDPAAVERAVVLGIGTERWFRQWATALYLSYGESYCTPLRKAEEAVRAGLYLGPSNRAEVVVQVRNYTFADWRAGKCEMDFRKTTEAVYADGSRIELEAPCGSMMDCRRKTWRFRIAVCDYVAQPTSEVGWISQRDKLTEKLLVPDRPIGWDEAVQIHNAALADIPAPIRRLDVGNKNQRAIGCICTVRDWLHFEGLSQNLSVNTAEEAFSLQHGDDVEKLMLAMRDGKVTCNNPAALPDWFWMLYNRAQEIML